MALLGQQGDRLLKQAVVDKDAYVSTSALVSAYHLSHVSPQNNEIVRVPSSFEFLYYFTMYITNISLSFRSNDGSKKFLKRRKIHKAI